MEKITANDPEARSADLVADNIARLKALFPELVTEGKDGAAVNVDVLKQLVGDATVTDAEEKYGLNWHGKRRARQLALTPSLGTLRPCPEDSVDWDTTQNLMIEGDNLEVLKLLQKSYAGKVKLIYIDPPYNTGKDFVYPDNFQESIRNYLEVTGQLDGGRRVTSHTESSGRLHTDWLNMMYPRLVLANIMLEPQGVIFISIDDGEIGNLRLMCDEIFGEENLICQFTWVKKRKGSHLSDTHRSMTEYVVAYAKNKSGLALFGEAAYSDKLQPLAKKTNSRKDLSFPSGVINTTLADGYYDEGPRGKGGSTLTFRSGFNVSDGVVLDEVVVEGPFVWTQEKLSEEMRLGTTVHLSSQFGFNVGRHDQLQKFKAPSTLMQGVGTNEDAFEELVRLFGVERVFDFTKPTSLVKYLVNSVTYFQRSGIVMDFFAGSGTTGEAVMSLNAEDGGDRRFVLVQLPEPLDAENAEQQVAARYCADLNRPASIAELTKERLRRAGSKIRDENPGWQGDAGFRVLKLDLSNVRAWHPTGDLENDLVDSIEHILPDRSEHDVLTELLLKLGLDLCVPIEQREIAGSTVHAIGGGVLMASLGGKIGRDDAEPLALGIAEWHRELDPVGDTTCVFRDSAFENDEAKTNLAAILEQHGVRHVRSL